jgi:plastocyanin
MGNTYRIAAHRGWWAIIVTAVVGLVLSIAPSASAASITIHINGGLDPATVAVPPNTVVTFVNDDGARHRMRTTGGPAQFDTGGSLEAAGSSFTMTLTALGTYTYRDERNAEVAELAGTIVVTDTVTTTVPGSPTTVAPPPPMTATVSIGDRIYTPSSITIAPGGTVTWTNNDGRAHTVTATDGSWDSGLMNTGATWSRTFPAGGTFSYFCDLHPDMTGRVVVSAGGTQPPGPTPPPATTPATTRPPALPPTTPAPTTTLPGTPPPTLASVMIMDFQYSPTTVTIAAGGTVTWTNHDSAPHTVTADDGSYDSGMMRTGGTWSKTFTAPGTYRYHCDYHPEMVATVVVLAPGATVSPGGTTATNGTNGTTATTVAGGGSTGGGSTGGSTGASTGGASLPTTGSVAITGNRFTPGTITIAVGGTITWTNNDAVPHTVTADDGSFDSGLMRRGGTWSKTFTAPGTYTYFCSLHPEMTATVVVATPDDPTPAVVTGGGGSPSSRPASGAAAASSAAGATATAAGSASVSMANNRFQPVSVTVGVGGVVTWTNTDSIPHTVTADDGSFDSDILMPGQTFSYQFETPGTVPYKCILHAGMTGEVVVSELPADASAGAHAEHTDAATATDVAVPAESPDRVISITGGTFPAVTVLAAGHSVTWRNDDTVDHNVTALFGEFESGVLKPGDEFTFTFDEAGVHPYTCDLHQHMGGTIIVMPAEDVDLANSPTVAVTDTGFEPPNLTVHQGTTVIWAFGGQLPHTVTADDASFDSGILQPGQTFTFTFDELGEFPYTCILHPMMMGTVTVVPADAAIGEGATQADGSAVAGAVADTQGESGNGAARGDGGGISTPIVVGFGVGGGLLTAVLLALGVGVVTRRTTPHLA